MVLQTPTPSQYTRIKRTPKSDRFARRKSGYWPEYFSIIIKDTEFSPSTHFQHFWKATKSGKASKDYQSTDLSFDSILGRYDLFKTISQKSHNIAPSLPPLVKKRIQELEQLAVGWDSYSASPINDEAIQSAKWLLILISSNFGLQPAQNVFIAPCSDGGIQLEWELNSKELIIKIEPDGKQLFFLKVSPSGEETEGPITSKSQLDDLLQEILHP